MSASVRSVLLIAIQHAEACYEFENQRWEHRVDELHGMRETRFEQYVRCCAIVGVALIFRRIKTRLLELGYSAVDVDSNDFRCHSEVRVPKPVTDRSMHYRSSFSVHILC